MEGLQEGGDLASGGNWQEGIAELVKVLPELRVVLRLPGIEPAAAGGEPVARVADWGEEAACQDKVTGDYMDKVTGDYMYFLCDKSGVGKIWVRPVHAESASSVRTK
jgi:hypothetical protein